MSAGQLHVLQQISLLRLTALMERYSMQSRNSWHWYVILLCYCLWYYNIVDVVEVLLDILYTTSLLIFLEFGFVFSRLYIKLSSVFGCNFFMVILISGIPSKWSLPLGRTQSRHIKLYTRSLAYFILQ